MFSKLFDGLDFSEGKVSETKGKLPQPLKKREVFIIRYI